MRVILDTNVLLSALIRVDSKPYQVVQAWFDGRFELASSAAQSEEFHAFPVIRAFVRRSDRRKQGGSSTGFGKAR